MIKGFHSLIKKDLRTLAVFQVDLADEKSAFMCVEETNLANEERCVVIVEADAFLDLWRNDPSSIHREQSHGTVESWKADYKYHYAAAGFSHGIDNPVPLANVSCAKRLRTIAVRKYKFPFIKTHRHIEHEETTCVAFTNGVTRTIWLLAQGAKWFPVECRIDNDAQLLVQTAGTNSKDVSTVASLFAAH